MKAPFLATLLLGLIVLPGACRSPLKVCSNHSDCRGGKCVLGNCVATGMTSEAGTADHAPEAGADYAVTPSALLDADDDRPEDRGDGGVADIALDNQADGPGPPPALDCATDVQRDEGGMALDAVDSARDSGLGLVGYIRSTTGTALALRVQDSHVFLGDWGLDPASASERGNLQNYDVSDPAHPVLQDSLYLCDKDCELGDITGDDSRLFVAADVLGVVTFDPLGTGEKSFSARSTSPVGTGGFVASVTLATRQAPDPRSFLLVGAHRSSILALYDVTGSSVLQTPIQYPVLGGTADNLLAIEARAQVGYVYAQITAAELGFETVDLSPLPGGVPVQMAVLPWPSEKYGGPGTMKVQGDFVYVAASSRAPGNGLVGGAYGGLRVIDVSDPRHPFFAGSGLDLPNVGFIPWNGTGLDVDASSAYFVTEKGLSVIDVSTPTQPQSTAFYPFPVDFLPCLGGRAMAQGGVVYVAAFCQSADGLRGTGGLAIYRVR